MIADNGKILACWQCVKPSAKLCDIRQPSFHTNYVVPANNIIIFYICLNIFFVILFSFWLIDSKNETRLHSFPKLTAFKNIDNFFIIAPYDPSCTHEYRSPNLNRILATQGDLEIVNRGL